MHLVTVCNDKIRLALASQYLVGSQRPCNADRDERRLSNILVFVLFSISLNLRNIWECDPLIDPLVGRPSWDSNSRSQGSNCPLRALGHSDKFSSYGKYKEIRIPPHVRGLHVTWIRKTHISTHLPAGGWRTTKKWVRLLWHSTSPHGLIRSWRLDKSHRIIQLNKLLPTLIDSLNHISPKLALFVTSNNLKSISKYVLNYDSLK